jgi:hypothetical protein
MTEAVALREADALPVWNPKQVIAMVDLVHSIMKEVMRPGEHYGVIPGTERKDKDGKDISKPSLLQPGAQKLCMTFRLVPRYDVEETILPGGHLDVRTKTTLTHIETERVVGSGVGSCSTMEAKYRWRKSERTCPSCGKPAIIKGKAEYGGGWLCFDKKGGCKAKYKDDDPVITSQIVGQAENPDIADTWNTVRKMSKKRSFVDATIQALAVSDLFTQDVEDFQASPPVEPAEPKDVTPPPVDNQATVIAFEEWNTELSQAADETKLKALWKSLSVKGTWERFSGEQQVKLTMAKDKRKGALSESGAQASLV